MERPFHDPQLTLNFYRVEQVAARPFVKWAGGKGQLLVQMAPFFPPYHAYRRYFEPFLGGGAVFFHLQPSIAFLSDTNEELINAFRIVRDHVEELIQSLRKHRNEAGYYYQVRAQDPKTLSPVERASRFIFLNKTCYNGLYRVNRKGRFNVPFGRYKNPKILDEENLRSASIALRSAHLEVKDFEEALTIAERGDFIYLDPPYHPLSATSSFTSYTSSGFGEDQQRRLASVYRDLDQRGALLMLSNSDTPLIRELYHDFRIIELQANRAINSRGDRRGPVTELLTLNY